MNFFESKAKNNIDYKTKEDLWDIKLKELNKVVDGLGKHIDANIKETVVAFLMNDFPTYGSCEGHVEERFGKMIKLPPYVGVGFEYPQERFEGEAKIKELILKLFNAPEEDFAKNEKIKKAFYDYINKNQIPESKEYIAVRNKTMEKEEDMKKILESFYKNREVEDSKKLKIRELGGGHSFYVTPLGNEKRETEIKKEDVEKHEEDLKKEQEEVKAFTQFLKEKYLNEK